MSSHDDGDGDPTVIIPPTIPKPRKTYEEWQSEKADRAMFFTMLGVLMGFIAVSFWFGLVEAFTVAAGGLYLFGLVTSLSR